VLSRLVELVKRGSVAARGCYPSAAVCLCPQTVCNPLLCGGRHCTGPTALLLTGRSVWDLSSFMLGAMSASRGPVDGGPGDSSCCIQFVGFGMVPLPKQVPGSRKLRVGGQQALVPLDLLLLPSAPAWLARGSQRCILQSQFSGQNARNFVSRALNHLVQARLARRTHEWRHLSNANVNIRLHTV